MRPWLRRLRCVLFGHADLLVFEADRIALICTSCDRQTPGWAVELATKK